MDKQLVQMLVCGLIMALAFNQAYASQESSNLKLTMTPATIIRGLTREVHLRCDVKESFQGSVETLKVTWRNNDEEKTVAKVTSQAPVATDMTDGDLTAEGSAQGRPFLDLTWSRPALMKTSGTYVCTLIATRTDSNHHHEEINMKLPTRAATVADLTKAVKEEETKIAGLEQENTKLTACNSPRVAFYALLNNTHRFDFKKNEVLKYIKIKINTDGVYDTSTGIFTTREAGIYKFNLHVYGYEGTKADLYIALNGQAYAALYADNMNDFYPSASTSAVVHLNVGDEISVVAGSDGAAYQYAGKYARNSFSGVLIQSDACLNQRG